MKKMYLSLHDRFIDRSEIIGTRVREKRKMDGFYSIRVGWHVDLVLCPKWYTFGRPRKVKMKGYIEDIQTVNEFCKALEALCDINTYECRPNSPDTLADKTPTP
jgi:hypothetical protein